MPGVNEDVSRTPYYVGWDVGGWNCDRNKSSRDALAILDADLHLVGRTWRGNLRSTINEAATPREFVERLVGLCGGVLPTGAVIVTLGIDTPLGFSRELTRLLTSGEASGPLGDSASNPYLYRRTERFLFERGLSPLSAVKDMLGSQATKGIHALARFAPEPESCGVWRSAPQAELIALEAYPSGCKRSQLMMDLLGRVTGTHGKSTDERDAVVCALVAYLFQNRHHELEPPDASVPVSEGWIWLPKDALQGD